MRSLALWAEGDGANDRMVERYLERLRAIGESGASADLDAIMPELARRWPPGNPQYGVMGEAFTTAGKALARRTKRPSRPSEVGGDGR